MQIQKSYCLNRVILLAAAECSKSSHSSMEYGLGSLKHSGKKACTTCLCIKICLLGLQSVVQNRYCSCTKQQLLFGCTAAPGRAYIHVGNEVYGRPCTSLPIFLFIRLAACIGNFEFAQGRPCTLLPFSIHKVSQVHNTSHFSIRIYRKSQYFFRRYDTIYRYLKRYIDIFDIPNHHYNGSQTVVQADKYIRNSQLAYGQSQAVEITDCREYTMIKQAYQQLACHHMKTW